MHGLSLADERERDGERDGERGREEGEEREKERKEGGEGGREGVSVSQSLWDWILLNDKHQLTKSDGLITWTSMLLPYFHPSSLQCLKTLPPFVSVKFSSFFLLLQ